MDSVTRKVVRHFPPHDLYIHASSRFDVLVHKPLSKCEIVHDERRNLLSFFERLREDPKLLHTVLKHAGYLEASYKMEPSKLPAAFKLMKKRGPVTYDWIDRVLPLASRLKLCHLEQMPLADFLARHVDLAAESYLDKNPGRRIFVYLEKPKCAIPKSSPALIMVRDRSDMKYPGLRHRIELAGGECLFMNYRGRYGYEPLDEIRPPRPGPVCRCYGAKSRDVAAIVRRIGTPSLYAELCAGSAAVLFAKPPGGKEILNDLDPSVTNFFKQVQNHPEELQALIWASPFSRERPRGFSPLHLASEFCARGAQGYNGHRDQDLAADRNGEKVRTWAKWYFRIPDASARLQGVKIRTADAVKVAESLVNVRDAVLFVDPPYLTHEHSYKYKLDYRKLVEVLHRCKGQVIVTERLVAMPHFQGWYFKASERLPVSGSNSGKRAFEYKFYKNRVPWSRPITKWLCESLRKQGFEELEHQFLEIHP